MPTAAPGLLWHTLDTERCPLHSGVEERNSEGLTSSSSTIVVFGLLNLYVSLVRAPWRTPTRRLSQGHCSGEDVDRRRPTLGVSQGRQHARLQILGGGLRGLRACHPTLARSLPGELPVHLSQHGRPRYPAGGPCAGVLDVLTDTRQGGIRPSPADSPPQDLGDGLKALTQESNQRIGPQVLANRGWVPAQLRSVADGEIPDLLFRRTAKVHELLNKVSTKFS